MKLLNRLNGRKQNRSHKRKHAKWIPIIEELESRLVPSTLFVDDSNLLGSGTGAYSNPFVQIQDAIDVAKMGDEIQVAAGTYHENIVMRPGVNVIGAGAEQTTLIGEASESGVVLFQDVTQATLSGFTITVEAPSSGVDRGVVFLDNTDSSAVLERNVITDTEIAIEASTPATIRHNTLVGVSDSIGISFATNETALDIRNNIITNYDDAGLIYGGEEEFLNPVIGHNDVYGNGINYSHLPDQTGLLGNISADPLFVSPSNFHLQTLSFAVDAGDPTLPADVDETAPDMGVFPTYGLPVELSAPAEPLYVGAFTKVPIVIDPGSGVTLDDLEFAVAEGPAGGEISFSRDATFDPTNPDIMLLGGYQPGTYHLEVHHTTTAELLARAEFSLTTFHADQDEGPSMWLTGTVGPISAPDDTIGTRNIAILFVDTASERYTTDETTLQEYRDRWLDETVDGVDVGGNTVSVAHYFQEVSYNNLDVTADVFGPVALPGMWEDYYELNGSGLWQPKGELWQAAVTEADDLIDFATEYDSLVVVSKEAGGRYAWPYARNTMTLTTEEGDINVRRISMPNEWGDSFYSSRTIHETLSHELGHNLGLGDLYTPDVAMPNAPAGTVRNLGGFDMMDADSLFPHFSLANRINLGWVDETWIETFDLAAQDYDETITLSPIADGAPGAGEKAGIQVKVANGWDFFFEYRVSQSDQIADQQLPTDNIVLGTDQLAAAGRPNLLLLPNDTDGVGSVLSNGDVYDNEFYEVFGMGFDFSAEVNGIDGNTAEITIQSVAEARPDPSIREWPAPDGPWQSPDIEVQNAQNGWGDPGSAWFNVPWAGQQNIIVASVENSGDMDASQVTVVFRQKDYNIGGDVPVVVLGQQTTDIPAGATIDFFMDWVPPDEGHYCIEVEILPYETPPPAQPIAEITSANNLAQSNYFQFISETASPASREMTYVSISNPYAEATEAYIVASQTNPLYRTFIGNRWLQLDPGEVKSIPVMVEYMYDHTTTPNTQYHVTPNRVDIVGLIREPDGDSVSVLGGTQLQVVTGRATRFTDFGPVSPTVPHIMSGHIETVDNGTAVPTGKVVVVVQTATGTEYISADVANGSFTADVGTDWYAVQAHYVPGQGFGKSTSEELFAFEVTIAGGSGDDNIVVEVDPDTPDSLLVTVTGSVEKSISLPVAELDNLTIDALDGNDRIEVRSLPRYLIFNVNAGPGDDEIEIHDAALRGHFGGISVDGGDGEDTLTAQESARDLLFGFPRDSKFDSGAWLITGVNEGLYGTTSNVTTLELVPGRPASFTGIENLGGTGGNDTFVFEDGAYLTGMIDGQEGTDVADYSDWTSEAPTDWEMHPNVEALIDHNNHHSLPVLRREYGFQLAGSYYENAFGDHEKWFQDRLGRWFAITPDGRIRQWDGNNDLSTSPVLATVLGEVYQDPMLLFNAEYAWKAGEQAQLSSLREENGFRFAHSYYEDYLGLAEKWLQDRNGEWYFITPNGTIHHWNGHSGSTSPVVATVAPLVFDDPQLLFNAEVNLSDTDQTQLAKLRVDYGFDTTGSNYENYLGQNETWFTDRQGVWHFITPDGQIHEWQTSSVVATVSSLVFDDPTLLFNAEVELSDSEQTQVADLQERYGFQASSSEYKDYFGYNEKWFQDEDDRWYTITPDGSIRLWGSDKNLLDDEVIALVSPLVYDDLMLLYDAV